MPRPAGSEHCSPRLGCSDVGDVPAPSVADPPEGACSSPCVRCGGFGGGPSASRADAFGRALQLALRLHDEELAALRGGWELQAQGEEEEEELQALSQLRRWSVGQDAAEPWSHAGEARMSVASCVSVTPTAKELVGRWEDLCGRALAAAAGTQVERHFEVLQNWCDLRTLGADTKMVRHETHNWVGQLVKAGKGPGGFSGATGDSLVSESPFFKKLVMAPDSLFLLVWIIMAVANLLWDLVMMPLHLVDLVPFTSGFVAMNVLIMIYWLCDIPVQFLSGYYTGDGLVELRLAHISRRYFRNGFWFDVPVLAIDLITLLAFAWAESAFSGAKNGARIIRFLRIFRLTRLLRTRKLKGAFALLVEKVQRPGLPVVAKACKYIFMVLCINHYIACCWVGLAKVEGAETWLSHAGLHSPAPEYLYVLALHWSLTQFSPSTQNVGPANEKERAFACVVAMVALLAFSSFLSGITGAVNQMGLANAASIVEESRVRGFLMSQGISTKLFANIQSFLRGPYRSRQRILREEDIGFFAQLPETLKIELHLELYFEAVQHNPVFAHLEQTASAFFARLCHKAMSEIFLLENQEAFVAAVQSTGMYIFRRGQGSYRIPSNTGTSPNLRRGMSQVYCNKLRISNRHWLAEMSLFSLWTHVGTLAAEEHSTVVHLSVDGFFRVLDEHQDVEFEKTMRNLALLAVHYVQCTEERAVALEGPPVTDLPIGSPLLELAHRAEKFTAMISGGCRESLDRSRKSPSSEAFESAGA